MVIHSACCSPPYKVYVLLTLTPPEVASRTASVKDPMKKRGCMAPYL